MSQYMSFYLKDRDSDRYLPLSDFSRSTLIYNAFQNEVPYGKTVPLKFKTVADITTDISSGRILAEEGRKQAEKRIQTLMQANNPIGEKIEVLEEMEMVIEEYNAEIREHRDAMSFLRLLEDIIDSAEYYSSLGLDKDEYLWVAFDTDPNEEEK